MSTSLALGNSLAVHGRPLVYGGGSKGMMGITASAVLQEGGAITAVVPSAIHMAGGEGERIPGLDIELETKFRDKVSR